MLLESDAPGKGGRDGLAMAAGTTTAGVTICTECLALCDEIVKDG